jgi:hydrogenase maturation protease
MSSPAPAAWTKTTNTEPSSFRVLVGGVGYRYLRDHSVGPWVVDELSVRAGNGIEVEDVSYHPVGLHQNLTDRPPYDRVVLVGAVNAAREPGTIHAYRWDGRLPPTDEVQQRVNEAVTGVISLPNLLIVCGALGGFPEDVRVVEVEPADDGWGEGFSPEVERIRDQLLETVWSSTRP